MANVNKRSGKTLRAEIAGAGFAGLTAATALAQRGWSVTLHEKGPELRAFGAGIYLWHNGLRVLEGIGALEDVLNGSHTPPIYETRRHNLTVSRETFNGLPWRIMTRQHLHDALANKARASRCRNPYQFRSREGRPVRQDRACLWRDSARPIW